MGFGPDIKIGISPQVTSDIDNLILMAKDQGHLFVPPAYYQVASDQAVQLNAAADWIAQKIIPECDFELSSLAWYVTAVGTEGDGTLELYSHDATNDQPDSSLATLATTGSGDTADTWIAATISTAQQLYAGKIYWIVLKGAASVDFSASTRRWNTAQGSMFPDSMPSAKYSTDSGSTWSACEQDSKPALMNLILNPVPTDLVPSLYYGRSTGKYVITTAGPEEIPVAGISLDCSDLTADTLNYVYLTTALALEASTTTWTRNSDGLMVKVGDTTKKFVGLIYPKDILGSGDQAPVDCMDRRLVAYKGMQKTIGKYNPYVLDTSETGAIAERQFKNNNDWKAEFIGNAIVSLRCGYYRGTSAWSYCGIGIDSTTTHPKCEKVGGYSQYTGSTSCLDVDGLDLGYHYAFPIIYAAASSNIVYRYASASPIEYYSNFSGWVVWR
jgi:hypothetical protein